MDSYRPWHLNDHIQMSICVTFLFYKFFLHACMCVLRCCGWFLLFWLNSRELHSLTKPSTGPYTGKARAIGCSVQWMRRDQPSVRERENIPSGGKLIEPVNSHCSEIPLLISYFLTPFLCVFFFKYPKNILAVVCGAHWIEALGLRSQTLYMCLSTAVKPVFPQ